MRIDGTGAPIVPGQAGVPGAQPGGSDLMSNIRSIIDGVKEAIGAYKGTLELEREVRGSRPDSAGGKEVIEMSAMKQVKDQIPPPAPPPPPQPQPAPPAPVPQDMIIGVLDNLIAQGNGDKTLGDFIAILSPFTIKQARDYLDGTRPTK